MTIRSRCHQRAAQAAHFENGVGQFMTQIAWMMQPANHIQTFTPRRQAVGQLHMNMEQLQLEDARPALQASDLLDEPQVRAIQRGLPASATIEGGVQASAIQGGLPATATGQSPAQIAPSAESWVAIKVG